MHTPTTLFPQYQMHTNTKFPFDSLDLVGKYSLFDSHQGAVMCGGTAYLLAEVYELFDYKAWILDTGDSPSLATHMVTLVRIRHEGRWIYSVLDAYFNVAFVTSTGQPLDYSQLVLHLINRQHEAIFLHSVDFCAMPAWPFSLVSPLEVEKKGTLARFIDTYWPVLEDYYSVEQLPDGKYKFISPRSLGEKFIRTASRYHTWLSSVSLPLDIRYVFLCPLNIVNAHGAPATPDIFVVVPSMWLEYQRIKNGSGLPHFTLSSRHALSQ